MFLTQTSEKTHDPFKILDEILRNQFVVGQTCHPCFWQKKPPKREKTPWCCFSPPPVLQKKSKISSKTASSPGHSAGDLQLLGIFKGHRGDQNHRGWWFFSLSFPHIKSTLLFFRKGLVFFCGKGGVVPTVFCYSLLGWMSLLNLHHENQPTISKVHQSAWHEITHATQVVQHEILPLPTSHNQDVLMPLVARYHISASSWGPPTRLPKRNLKVSFLMASSLPT